jgi:hypothetical protein
MAYSDFTLSKVERQFGLTQKKFRIIPDPKPCLAPSQALTDDMTFAGQIPIFSEKSKSEHIITPILKEIFRRNIGRATYFSGYTFDVDVAANLNGVCDYIFTRNTESVEIKSPVFCLVEAKNRTIEEGLGQCAAEMVAARLFNLEAGEPVERIYGAVTTGFEWVFLRLEGNDIQIDLGDRFFLNELPLLLGALQWIIDERL